MGRGPSGGLELGMFMSVWGAAPDDVTVVGGQDNPPDSQAVLLTFDGETWLEPELPPGVPWLNWVAGVDDEVWAVGREGTVLRRVDAQWSLEPVPTDAELWGVWGSSLSDVWVVGGDPVLGPPTLLHWDGASWQSMPTPFLEPGVAALFKVWGRSADEVYVVGEDGAVAVFDGMEWTARANDSIAPLFAVWAAPAKNPVAVGGRSSARIVSIEADEAPGVTLSLPGLNGVWVDEAGVATVVGDRGTIGVVQPGQTEVELEDSGTLFLLHATFGFEGGPRYAVGGSFHDPPPKRGIILRSSQ